MSHHGDTFPCPRCGERLPAGFTRCDACGAFLVPAPGSGARHSGGAARGSGGHGGAPRQAQAGGAGGVSTIAWVFLALGLVSGGVIGYSLHGGVGPHAMGDAPKGPADVMAGMSGGGGMGDGGGMGGGAPMSGGDMGGAPMGGGGMPAGAQMPAGILAEVQKYRAALLRDPNDVAANVGLGNLEFDSGQWEKAVTHYSLALAKNPGDADVRVDMAIALHNLGQDPKAIQELERVTKEHPDHKNAWLNLGVISAGAGDKKTAIRAWEKYLALDPNGPHAASIREQVQQLKSGA